MSRSRRMEGAVVEITLPNGMFAYGQILSDPLVGFWPGCFVERQPATAFSERPFELCLWVHNDAFKSGRWKAVGTISVSSNGDPWFFKQDAVSKEITLYQHRTGIERALSIEKLSSYEAAAVWDPEHVERRLQDACEGKANLLATSMQTRAIKNWMQKFGT